MRLNLLATQTNVHFSNFGSTGQGIFEVKFIFMYIYGDITHDGQVRVKKIQILLKDEIIVNENYVKEIIATT